MQEYKFVLEHIGMPKLGREVEVGTVFSGNAIAKVSKSGGREFYVAVKWDDVNECMKLIFDPYTTSGFIVRYEKLYIYDKEQAPIVVITPPTHSVKDPKTMKEDEIKIELLYVHGLTEEQYSELSNLSNRKAKVAELRLLKNEQK